MDTFELLPSLAQGDLGETTVAELVAAVLRSRASGTLAIETPGIGEIRAFFRAGDMCGTASFTGFHTLARVLTRCRSNPLSKQRPRRASATASCSSSRGC